MVIFLINAIINGILNLITSILNIVLLPINLLFENLFPDMTNSIETFNLFITDVIGNKLGYFFHILPPIFRNLLFIWFTFVVSYYTIHFTYLGVIKVFNIIRKIKFW